MQHRRLKQKHWPNMKCIRSTIRKEENSTACHNITTNSEQEHFSGFTTEQVSLRSQQQNFSSNLRIFHSWFLTPFTFTENSIALLTCSLFSLALCCLKSNLSGVIQVYNGQGAYIFSILGIFRFWSLPSLSKAWAKMAHSYFPCKFPFSQTSLHTGKPHLKCRQK